jgi:hypothetical protein
LWWARITSDFKTPTLLRKGIRTSWE